jgi:predicted membrane protein
MPLFYFAVALIIVATFAWLVNTYRPMPDSFKGIVNIVLALIVVGMGLWLINSYVPMAGSIKVILNVVVVAATCVRVLQAVGLWSGIVRLWSDLTSHRIAH